MSSFLSSAVMLLSAQPTPDAFTLMRISGAIYLDPVLNHDACRGKLDAFVVPHSN